MDNTNHLIQNIDNVMPNAKNIMLEFILTFSRLESALKNTPKYLLGDANRAEPNWSAFLMSIDKVFDANKDKSIVDSVNYIVDNPPRKQVNINGVLTWKDSTVDAGAALTKKLGDYIRRVRNNLMHGGKFHGNYEPESRNYQLLKSSLIVMNYMIDLDKDVKTNFCEQLYL